jgi:hypothetical protein
MSEIDDDKVYERFPTDREKLGPIVDGIIKEISKKYNCDKLYHKTNDVDWLLTIYIGLVNGHDYKILLCCGSYNVFNMFEESVITFNRTSDRIKSKPKTFLCVENSIAYVGEPIICTNIQNVIDGIDILHKQIIDNTLVCEEGGKTVKKNKRVSFALE